MRRFLNDYTAIIWLCCDDSADLTLRDDCVPTRGESDYPEELFDIFKATRNLVEEELRLTASVQTTSNLDLTYPLKPRIFSERRLDICCKVRGCRLEGGHSRGVRVSGLNAHHRWQGCTTLPPALLSTCLILYNIDFTRIGFITH